MIGSVFGFVIMCVMIWLSDVLCWMFLIGCMDGVFWLIVLCVMKLWILCWVLSMNVYLVLLFSDVVMFVVLYFDMSGMVFVCIRLLVVR